MCLQMDVILSFEHILFTFVTFLLSSKKKIVGMFAYREVYGVPHIFVLHV